MKLIYSYCHTPLYVQQQKEWDGDRMCMRNPLTWPNLET